MIDLIGSSCIKPYCVIDRQSYVSVVLRSRERNKSDFFMPNAAYHPPTFLPGDLACFTRSLPQIIPEDARTWLKTYDNLYQSYCAKVLLKRPPLSMKEQRRETRVTHAAVDIVATAGR